MDVTAPLQTHPLSEAYDNARKAYGFASGLLLAWELIGIEFEAAPLESVKVTLKSPQAIPYVLIALVLYFAFRITVEWYQHQPERRLHWASKADFVVAHVIGAASLTLYGIQTLLRVQLANRVPPLTLTMFVIGMLVGQSLVDFLWRGPGRFTWRDDKFVVAVHVIVVIFGPIILVQRIAASGFTGLVAPGAGFAFGIAARVAIKAWIWGLR